MGNFEQVFNENMNKFEVIDIHDEKARNVYELALNVVSRKKGKAHHIIDNKQELKRFYTGFLGEAAVEQLLGIDIIDYSVGDSALFHVSDFVLNGKKVGIKTVEYGKFPIIFKRNDYPQIICVKISNNRVYICGLATIQVLNKYQSDDLVLSPLLRNRGTKTGFYGLDHLIVFKSKNELEELLRR